MAGKKKYVRCSNCKYQYSLIKNEGEPLPKTCPSCYSKYWEKPSIERELATLQDEYLLDTNNRNQKSFDKMIILIEDVLHKIIASKLKGSAIYLDLEYRHDLVMESLVTFIEKYTKNQDFRVKGSFIGYLSQLVLNPMYHPKKKFREQNETSLNHIISNFDDSLELGDIIELSQGVYGSDEYVENMMQGELQINAIMLLLESTFIQCIKAYDLKTAIIILKSIQLQLNPNTLPEDLIDYWSNFSNDIRTLCEYSLKIIYEFVKTELIHSPLLTLEDYLDKFGEPKVLDDTKYTKDLESTNILEDYI